MHVRNPSGGAASPLGGPGVQVIPGSTHGGDAFPVHARATMAKLPAVAGSPGSSGASAILGAHPDVDVVGVCDSQGMVTSALRSMTGIETFKESKKLFREVRPDCVVISTPSAAHYEAASLALEDDIHVFVEKMSKSKLHCRLCFVVLRNV